LTDSLSTTSAAQLARAVHRFKPASRLGILERLFTLAFRGLVYPQIWEDPEVDLKALALAPGARIITIASGGCNALSYLTADPAEVIAVDLNHAHVALTRLKLAAARFLPTYDAFYRFFGKADDSANVAAYERFLHDRLDAETLRYWDGRDLLGRRRISLFARNFYHRGLSGRFIGLSHLVARLHGVDPRQMIWARTIEEQRAFFETSLAPLFDRRFFRWVTARRISLYGLGIPPAQYDALLSSGGAGGMASILRQRLERLACAFPMSDNYFAWQAFGRSYGEGETRPLPPYLRHRNFYAIRDRAERITIVHQSVTERLRGEAAAGLDGYVLLDAQDWMTGEQLNDLWREITRTARRGARVIFRTAAEPSPLPGRVDDAVFGRWAYEAEASRALAGEDRSSAYGGFHLYRLKEPVA
jgi:S-adenosylmethionine-diacylglycerol 3-amino-3-carboxypropyl transferase